MTLNAFKDLVENSVSETSINKKISCESVEHKTKTKEVKWKTNLCCCCCCCFSLAVVLGAI